MESFFIALALLAASLPAQKPAPKPTAAPPAPPAAAAPAPDKLESVQLENLELKAQLLAQEEASIPQRRAELQQQYGALIRKIESEHPGWVWNPQIHGLMIAPPASAPAAKKDEAPKK